MASTQPPPQALEEKLAVPVFIPGSVLAITKACISVFTAWCVEYSC
jgi:hypothetical protein